MHNWAEREEEIARVASLKLFFIGGAPRSGTTWLQRILDAHPDISCRSEGLFLKELAAPVGQMMRTRCRALNAKNTGIFRQLDGYPLPTDDDSEFLVGSAILLALRQQSVGRTVLAVGEKTPENVFFFPRLKRLFPGARFIGIARDPRDVLTSAWHFFLERQSGEDEDASKTAFLKAALASLAEGAQAMLALAERYASDCMLVTYEALLQTPETVAATLFRFLGVSDRNDIITDCLAKASFPAAAAGGAAGVVQAGSFFRKGIAGDWPSTLTPAQDAMVLRELGWMFPHFSWPMAARRDSA